MNWIYRTLNRSVCIIRVKRHHQDLPLINGKKQEIHKERKQEIWIETINENFMPKNRYHQRKQTTSDANGRRKLNGWGWKESGWNEERMGEARVWMWGWVKVGGVCWVWRECQDREMKGSRVIFGEDDVLEQQGEQCCKSDSKWRGYESDICA